MAPEEEQELAALRRKVREMGEELAEYRAIDRHGASVAAEVRARDIADALRTPVQGRLTAARLIAFLIDHPKTVHEPHQILPHVTATEMEDCSHHKTVHVAVCRARQMLEPHGLARGIRTVRAIGYRMTPACAEAIKILIAAAARG